MEFRRPVSVSTLLVATAIAWLGPSQRCTGELLVFSAPWCRACRLLDTPKRRLLQEGYPIREVNVDQEPELARRFGVRGVPTLVLLERQREIRRHEGPQSYDQLKLWFQQAGVRQSAPPRRPPDARDTSQRHLDGDRQRDLGRAIEQPSARASDTPSHVDIRRRAERASVRIRVDDETGRSYGSGTIIDSHRGHALVLTCGHIFRESRGKGPIHVDLFGGPSQTVQGTLVKYDLQEDIALISIPLSARIDSVPVALHGQHIRPQAPVFSVGCDRGADPTVQRSRVVDVNRYLGSENVVVQGQPVDGRSGGGLFDENGELIGVCNAADRERDEGLFAGLPVVHRILDRANLAAVYQPGLAREGNAGRAQPVSHNPGARTNVAPPATNRSEPLSNQVVTSDDDVEVICIVRSKKRSSNGHEVILLNDPSRELLSTLRSAGRISRDSPTVMR